jgi:sodium/potassium-transporting ATPase subunit alpha
VAEIPFHPTNKYHLSIHENEDKSGYMLLMKGAPETIFNHCSTILYRGEQLRITTKLKRKFIKNYTNFCQGPILRSSLSTETLSENFSSWKFGKI